MKIFNKSILATCFLCLCSAFNAMAKGPSTTTPIKHLVVIFQENRTFDHYFGSYPYAQNNPGETPFIAKKNTPSVNGFSWALLALNQNLSQPFRLSPLDAVLNISDPDHEYTALQAACDSGLMDRFVETTGIGVVPPNLVMGYFDGNTVTALWNYAQRFAMSDNFHTTNIGASTVGAINLISGQSHGVIPENFSIGSTPVAVQGTLINDADPVFDQCSTPSQAVAFTGMNIGDLLNAKGVTWGWFQGGFANCASMHVGAGGQLVTDYIPHHNPFQYYLSTCNPQHLPPSSIHMVGKTDQANHNYDLSDFWASAEHGNLPSVSFLKAPAYQDGHAGYSNPFLEQQFLVSTINALQKLPQWKEMAIIIAYDDSGGWYDHELPPIINQSQIPEDALIGPGNAGTSPPFGGYQGRPAYGFRVPFILISPWAKENYVDHTLIDQTSILRFIEENWKLGSIGNFSFDVFAGTLLNMFDFRRSKERQLILDPNTGAPVIPPFLQ
ncbi:phospholipase C [Candidatus Protochlamydia phocaeensis]|uniref:phospholipase C n=1 Tax=Candidatus Protochlamydia phocaeensis TaxID=1414722 RepID=UPI00083866A0|nr:alkaline phosphatase family protein [Candidatus Protochlamydia phocaeensis]